MVESQERYQQSYDEDDGEEVESDYPAIYCYFCRKQLRTVESIELEDIHTHSNGEDVCEACCDACAKERKRNGNKRRS